MGTGTPVLVRGKIKARKQRSSKGTEIGSANEFKIQASLNILEVSITGPQCTVESLNDLPTDIVLKEDTIFAPDQRYLQLRNDASLRKALSLRSAIQDQCRKFLSTMRMMTEIETPLLFKSTSEGAREFLVPTRRKGYAYALPQSPQQFKQILMSSGIGGYFQFAKCFRDEDLRADRQPEFSQLDLELAFAGSEDIICLVEQMLADLWTYLDIGGSTKRLSLPLQRLSYADAMLQYGSDKPDLRIPIKPFTSVGHLIPADLTSKISPLADPVVEAMIVPLQCSAKQAINLTGEYLDSPGGKQFMNNPAGAPGIFVYDSQKPLHGLSALGFEAAESFEREFELEDGQLIILQARKRENLTGSSTALGNLRMSIFSTAVRQNYLPSLDWNDLRALWVTDFPLFSPCDPMEPGQGGHAGFASTHHPFTSPKTPEDVDLLLSDPGKVTGDHYDLVINGEEIAGGSRRIHQAAMQEFVFREILKMDEPKVEEFRHLLEALRAGCPPHAGIAFGFDRLVAMLVSSKLEKHLTMRDKKAAVEMAPTIPSPRLKIKPEPLITSSFAPFGTVISAPLPASRTTLPYPPPQSSQVANQNTALKYPDISPLSSAYRLSPSGTPATPHVSLFSCFPRRLRASPGSSSSGLFDVKSLERHPYTTQTFVPLSSSEVDSRRRPNYLVIVAPTLPTPPTTAGLTPYFSQIATATGGGPPDLDNIKAFVADGGTAVTYGLGVWHAPMAVVGEGRIDFVVTQWMSGREGEDCQEVDLAGLDGQGIELVIDSEITVEKAKL
ncbi:uncharacterized protein KY384_001960 [Bacidia gigantensis]|uniref:uncharacterized protein n=1 Tax=Bacidia gigantensis TaxID=2732470 RepID=UPI001D04603B|nr:uncharacterized protein KY384_001960 [Bacidia gigantensis]KAG8533177.1 hypothetical protein KY384_001960 [Bacidia gigantensis]